MGGGGSTSDRSWRHRGARGGVGGCCGLVLSTRLLKVSRVLARCSLKVPYYVEGHFEQTTLCTLSYF